MYGKSKRARVADGEIETYLSAACLFLVRCPGRRYQEETDIHQLANHVLRRWDNGIRI